MAEEPAGKETGTEAEGSVEEVKGQGGTPDINMSETMPTQGQSPPQTMEDKLKIVESAPDLELPMNEKLRRAIRGQKSRMIAEYILANPNKPVSQIAYELGVGSSTVYKVRRIMELAGLLPKPEGDEDADGKRRRKPSDSEAVFKTLSPDKGIVVYTPVDYVGRKILENYKIRNKAALAAKAAISDIYKDVYREMLFGEGEVGLEEGQKPSSLLDMEEVKPLLQEALRFKVLGKLLSDTLSVETSGNHNMNQIGVMMAQIQNLYNQNMQMLQNMINTLLGEVKALKEKVNQPPPSGLPGMEALIGILKAQNDMMANILKIATSGGNNEKLVASFMDFMREQNRIMREAHDMYMQYLREEISKKPSGEGQQVNPLETTKMYLDLVADFTKKIRETMENLGMQKEVPPELLTKKIDLEMKRLELSHAREMEKIKHEHNKELMKIQSDMESKKWQGLWDFLARNRVITEALDKVGEAVGDKIANMMRGGK